MNKQTKTSGPVNQAGADLGVGWGAVVQPAARCFLPTPPSPGHCAYGLQSSPTCLLLGTGLHPLIRLHPLLVPRTVSAPNITQGQECGGLVPLGDLTCPLPTLPKTHHFCPLSSLWIHWVPRGTARWPPRTWRKRRAHGEEAPACHPQAASLAPGAMTWAWTARAPSRERRPGRGPSTTIASSRAVCSKLACRRPRTAARCPAQVSEGSAEGCIPGRGREAPSARPASHPCQGQPLPPGSVWI